MKSNYNKKNDSVQYRDRETLMLDFQLTTKTNKITKVPIIENYNVVGPLPSKMIAFHESIRSGVKDYDAIVHFYENDYLFIRLFRNPTKYIPILMKYRYVISPDLSQYIEMPYYSRFANNCHNKAMAQFLQNNGINIIANVTWSKPDSYNYCFDGIPVGTIIAINSNGVSSHLDSIYLWHKGYNEALKRLKPSLIIRYGCKMSDENEDISIYYENGYLRRMHHGS